MDEGTTVFHSQREEQAAEFMRNESLTKRGLRRFELKNWSEDECTFSLPVYR